ncbi:MAG TPA: T3SS effector HopA1 family protein [Nocardioidaceae bacterium]|nr:T3SS effector HopA1 family protein [Nocardioidaceae bacterium]
MSYRHVDEIDKAVHVARKALSLGHLRRPDRLTRFLYQRWYLGLSSQQAEIPAQRSHVWQAWSRDWTDQHSRAGSDLVRLYLTCAPHTSLHAIGLVSDRATTWDVPWRLTSTAMNQAVPAADATVLYLPLEALPQMRPELEELVGDLQPFLANAVPALTLRIARGASLAQNPADGRSFGEHRCGLVARSVIESQNFHHREQVVRTMRTFAAAGIDPKRPYLESAGSWDRPWVFA